MFLQEQQSEGDVTNA